MFSILNGHSFRGYNQAGRNQEIKDFAELISGSLYFGDGRYTVSTIGERYCDADWVQRVRAIMADMFSAAGIQVSVGDTSGVVQFALDHVGKGIYEVLPMGQPTSDGRFSYFGADWCAMFVSYCFDSCGLVPDVLDHTITCCETSQWYAEGKFKLKGSYTPKAGDIIMYGTLGNCYHTGIVTDCDGTTVYTVEGNSGPGGWWGATKVVTHQYSVNYSEICGYYTASEF